MEIAQGADFSITAIQEAFTHELELMPNHRRDLTVDETRGRDCELWCLRFAATVPRPDFRAHLARLAAGLIAPLVCDIFRKNY